MSSTLALLVPLALGVAASPLPIIAVLVVLLTRRARLSSLVLASAWVVGNIVAITIAIAFADRLGLPREGLDLPFEGAVTALLGIGLISMAVVARRGRFRSEDPQAPPNWVNAVDGLSPVGGAVLAFTNATTSPKNLALALSAGIVIRGANLRPAEQTAAIGVYVALASISVVAPVVVYFVAGERAQAVLARWKTYITLRAAAGMEGMLFVLGLILSVKGLANLLT